MTEITYCNWEDVPAILANYSDGRILGFAKYTDWTPENAADIATKAGVLTEAAFNRKFPDAGLPKLPE